MAYTLYIIAIFTLTCLLVHSALILLASTQYNHCNHIVTA